MIKINRFVPILFLGIFYALPTFCQLPKAFSDISLTNLDAFQQAGKNWTISSDALADFTKKGDIQSISGTGAVVNNVSPGNRSHLITKQSFGDLVLELDWQVQMDSYPRAF
jgi:hypothetical protein